MSDSKIKQLKLVTGEEIMAEIIDEDEFDVFIRNVLAIQFHNLDNGQRMYTFKLFMCYQDDPDRLLLLKMNKIVAVANPIPELVEQYNVAVTSMFEDEETEDESFKKEYEKMTKMDSDRGNVINFPIIH